MRAAVVFALIFLVYTSQVPAVVLYSANFEDGEVPAAGKRNEHGVLVSRLGGRISGLPGDGTNDPLTHHNQVVDSSAEAHGSIPGSTAALKTFYAAGFGNSFQRNTMIIEFPEQDNIHVRWSQKWSKQWIWPQDQQKLIKIASYIGGRNQWSNNFKIAGGNTFYITGRYHGLPSRIYQFLDMPITNTRDHLDDINNGIGPGGIDAQFRFEVGKWYDIEVQLKANTPGREDAELRLWIDGKLITEKRNWETRSSKTSGVNVIELQHIYQNAGQSANTVSMPTWMDNIVISDRYIGPASVVRPNPPTQLLVGP